MDAIINREPYAISAIDLANAVQGKRILITGAGGSIGSELAMMVSQGTPEAILMLSHSEFPLYTIENRVKALYPNMPCSSALGDVRSFERMKQIFHEFKPDIVIHSAAVKHVPIAEKHPSEAIFTNVIGSVNVAMAAYNVGAEKMIFISTDKAVYPTCVMGATKRLAEIYLTSLPVQINIVRFGNVLGTSGSVIPLFEKQIREGKEVTITHPDMERYFMTVNEAVSLTLQTLNFDTYYRANPLFTLNMGKQVNITDLAISMMDGKEIPIRYTGLRPGEKLTESLFYKNESAYTEPCEGIFQRRCRRIREEQLKLFSELEATATAGNDSLAAVLLHSILPEYT